MATDVKLPELGEGVTEGELIKWLVKPGDSIGVDQAIAEIMTDKASVEVPSPVAGVVSALHFKEGDTVSVGKTMISLNANQAINSGTSATSPAAAKAAQAPAVTAPQAKAAQPAAPAAASVSAASGASSGQAKPIKLPELGEGVTEGELVKWLVQEGDEVKVDQAVVEIMTDKASVEVPTPEAGRVVKLNFKPGEMIKVSDVFMELSVSGASAATATPALAAKTTSAPLTVSAAKTSSAGAASAMGSGAALAGHSGSVSTPATLVPLDPRVLATPYTRRLARELGVDLNTVRGTGLAGRVTHEDVLRAKQAEIGSGFPVGGITGSAPAQASPSAATNTAAPKAARAPEYALGLTQEEERIPLRGVRKKIAENMQFAKRTIPHFTLMDEACVDELVAMRESMKQVGEKAGVKITYLPFVMKALIATVREFPEFNGSIDDEKQEIVYKKYFNLGFAADTPQGLLVPVIKQAQTKSILELASEINDLAVRARDQKLKLDEMKGATITITNIGAIGGNYATPIINHPEVAILGMYRISDKLFLDPKTKQVGSKKVMNFTITCDHRLIDGARAAVFLKAFIERIESPAKLMLELR